MKRLTSVLLSVLFGLLAVFPIFAAEIRPTVSESLPAQGDGSLELDAKGAILMEAGTGTVLYAEGADEKLYPASVTKIMTMLLVMEALDNGVITETDLVTASEHACSYGGTQIYLEPGETMTVRDLLKAVSVNSANDAAAALAEYLAGSEGTFVAQMNKKAEELGMNNTHFVNPCGLPDPEHYTCAYDVALMTRELLKHPHILDYTGIWMDSLRNGAFGLANTNKLLKTYRGMTGMKTGYTDEAGHCLSATATRDGMTLIAVILGGETSKGRFSSAATLLDYGFSGFTVVTRSVGDLSPVAVKKGVSDFVSVRAEGSLTLVLPKNKTSGLTMEVRTEESVAAPVTEGQVLGWARFLRDGQEVLAVPVVAAESVEKAGFSEYFTSFLEQLFG